MTANMHVAGNCFDSELSDLRNDELGTGAPSVSAVGDEARVVCSRLDTRLMGRPEKFNGQHALWLDCKFQIEAYFGFLFWEEEGKGLEPCSGT